jgi:hypothetical protein
MKCRSTPTRLNGTISQKALIFIFVLILYKLHILLSYGTTAHIWALTSSVLRFLNHTIRHTVGLPWMCDQTVTEASTYPECNI